MRIMIAGASSGCGKTMLTLALLERMRREGLRPAAFKSGPDYIDPGLHAFAAGHSSHNLDLWLMGETGVRQVLDLGMRGCDIGLIEGAMSYYDGIGPEGACSARALAAAVSTPVLLAVDASGSATGAAAAALGFVEYMPESGIRGFLLNGISSEGHYALVRDAVERRTGLPCVGYLPRSDALRMPSRHLGLVQAGEQTGLRAVIDLAADLMHVDLERLRSIAAEAPELSVEAPSIHCAYRGWRMGVARDRAFSFYYESCLEMLRRMGFEIVEFSPIADKGLPAGLDCLYLGGGYPEAFAGELSANRSFCDSLQEALRSGLRCWAECGGMMYLSNAIDGHPMTGYLPFETRMTDRLRHFGYVDIRDRQTGMCFRAHEFHYSEVCGPEDCEPVFDVRKASGRGVPWTGGCRMDRVMAGWPHVHFWGKPELVEYLWDLKGERAR